MVFGMFSSVVRESIVCGWSSGPVLRRRDHFVETGEASQVLELGLPLDLSRSQAGFHGLANPVDRLVLLSGDLRADGGVEEEVGVCRFDLERSPNVMPRRIHPAELRVTDRQRRVSGGVVRIDRYLPLREVRSLLVSSARRT